jgi:hypothetical protein
MLDNFTRWAGITNSVVDRARPRRPGCSSECRRLRSAALSGLIGFWALFPSVAHAQSTNLIVDVDSSVRLTCLSPLQLNVSAADLSNVLVGQPTNTATAFNAGARTAIASGNALVVDLPALSPNLIGDIRRYEFRTVGCLIEATPSLFGSVVVRITLGGNRTLLGPGGSRIRLQSVLGRRAGTADSFANRYTYPAWYHIFFDTQIEFQIQADLSQATHAGLHSSTTSGNFTVQVTAP